jgi:hypothetical protein
MIKKQLLLFLITCMLSAPLWAMEKEFLDDGASAVSRMYIYVSSENEGSQTDRVSLKRSQEQTPPLTILKDVFNKSQEDLKTSWDGLNKSGDAWDSAAETPLTSPLLSPRAAHPAFIQPTLIKLNCSTAEVIKLKTKKVQTLKAAMDIVVGFLGDDIKPHEVALIVDNDGTINNDPDPSKPSGQEFGEREGALAHMKAAKEMGMHVFVSSAWAKEGFNGAKEGFQETLERLEKVNCDRELLGIEGELIGAPFTLKLRKEAVGDDPVEISTFTGFQCGNVVSCKDASLHEVFMRHKGYAPAVVLKELCSSIKLVVLLDDSGNNTPVFRKDASYNPYGTNSVKYLPILLAPCVPQCEETEVLDASGVQEKTEKLDL